MTPEAKRRAIRTKYRNKVKSGAWRYNGNYDAYYDTKTREWVESKCADSECQFCASRPKLAPKRRVRPTSTTTTKEKR